MFGIFKRHALAREIDNALNADNITPEKIADFKERADGAGLPKDFIDNARQQHFQSQIKPIIDQIAATRRYSPADEEALCAIAKRFKVTPDFGDEFRRFRMLWKHENNEDIGLSPIASSLNLLKGEECYFKASGKWMQLKTIKTRTGYSGVGLSFRIAKGVRLYSGRSIPTYTEREGLVSVSDGELQLTNRRIIFNGNKKSVTVAYDKVMDIKQFRDGLEIFKASGKPAYFRMSGGDVELAAIIINKLLAE
jgi:hypothetical protein